MSLISISNNQSIFISILSSITAKRLRVAQQQIKLQPKVYTLHLKKKTAYSKKLDSADSTVF